jgi:2,4-dienoyl-CoA reductase (NADPH2)
MKDILFSPLKFRNLTVKNRLFRSSISGRIDFYDGHGSEQRINWEEKFAQGGIGAIISSHVPVHVRGRILPNYAFIDNDDKIPFWKMVGERLKPYDCKFIVQLSHSGRQQDIGGVENLGKKTMSSITGADSFHGFPSEAMSKKQIQEVTQQFADGARRVRQAGLDGIEIHGCNGYLFTQFLSSAINTRKDEYGGSLKNRARFLLEVIRAVRREVGDDFHLQVKISAVDFANALFFWEKGGNTLNDTLKVCRWIEEAGADAIHVSVGSMFIHPLNPAGDFAFKEAVGDYGSMMSSGIHTMRNYAFFRFPVLRSVFKRLWMRTVPPKDQIEGLNLAYAREIRQIVDIPVLCTGGFQTASLIRKAITDGDCDGVTMARTLIANPNLPDIFKSGKDKADRPCTYCNKCTVNVLEHPLGCYELSRFDGDTEEMISQVMSFYKREKMKFDTKT